RLASSGEVGQFLLETFLIAKWRDRSYRKGDGYLRKLCRSEWNVRRAKWNDDRRTPLAHDSRGASLRVAARSRVYARTRTSNCRSLPQRKHGAQFSSCGVCVF